MGKAHRQEVTDVFYFDQLSDEAKEKARDWWRDLERGDPAWTRERRDSLKAFCDEFDFKEPSWEYDESGWDIGGIQVDDQLEDLRGPRLMAYLWNQHKRTLVEPRQYTLPSKRQTFSKVQWVETSCPFTGYTADEALLEPIRKFLKGGEWLNMTYKLLMEDCLDAWGESCSQDVAWILSEEQVDEAIMSNKYEFDVEGNRV